MKKNILILTASYGRGHNSAAKNLSDEFSKNGNTVKTIDLVEFFSFGGDISRRFYEFISSEFPALRQVTYNVLDNELAASTMGVFNNIGLKQKFTKLIKEHKPTHIIVCYPFWNVFLRSYLKKYPKTFTTGVFITDAISIHGSWYNNNKYTDHFFVIDDQTKTNLIEKFNHQGNNITTSFFPLPKNNFIEKKGDTIKTIIIYLTALSSSFCESLCSYLAGTKLTVTIIQGRNPELFEELKQNRPQFEYFEFTPILERLKTTDILIAKPGGALTCECIATDTFLIFPTRIPGQEQGNKELLIKHNLGCYAPHPETVEFIISSTNRNIVRKNFSKLKKANSLEIIQKKMGI